MFNAFDARLDVETPRRLALSAMAAVAVLCLLAFGASQISASDTGHKAKEKSVDVSFRPPPPPPKPVKIENAPPPPVPKVVKVATPPPAVVAAPAPAAMVAPKELPKVAAPESDKAVAAIEVAVGGTGDGKGAPAPAPSAPAEDESPAPVAAAAVPGGPINLPEDAEPPEPADDNEMPEYPETERTTGHEATIILKIVIEATGTVGRITVMKGEEPFLAAALTAVRNWKYEPAKLEGQNIATFKIVKIPFRLKS